MFRRGVGSLGAAVRSQRLVCGTLQVVNLADALLEVGQQVLAIRRCEGEISS